VITPQEAFLNEARTWGERLDRGVETDRRQLYVYYVQNGRATELADALGQAFAITAVGTAEAASGPRLAPGLTPMELSQPQDTTTAAGTSPYETGEPSPANSALPQTERGTGGVPVLGVGAPGPLETGAKDTLRIVADARNNALLVYATGDEYRMIEAALKKLDIVPLQVLIEATIAEVTLNDSLKYGLEWFFDIGNSTITFNTSGTGTSTPTPTPNLILSQFPGFSYVFASDDVKVVLNALAQITDVKVISSPQLMVLDNEPARLQVGDQVPVAVRTSVSTDVTTTAPIVSEIQYRDTGVILDIIPRVNASGLVVLDIIQEVSDVVVTVVNADTTTAAQAQTPTISQRRIASTVAINSGETVALGGLIRDSATNSVTGVPLLSEIPLLGNLFKTTTDTTRRTELLVLLTPRVVRDRHDARAVTDELRQRLRGLVPLTEKIQ
jgi:general secretion pathway protein D